MTSPFDSQSDLPMILVVDDELRSRESLRRVLDQEFQVLLAESAWASTRTAGTACGRGDPLRPAHAPCQRYRISQGSARALAGGGPHRAVGLHRLREDIIAGVNQAGIYQYLLKPWLPENLLNTVRNAVESQSLQNHMQRLDLDRAPVRQRCVAAAAETLERDAHTFDFS